MKSFRELRDEEPQWLKVVAEIHSLKAIDNMIQNSGHSMLSMYSRGLQSVDAF